MVDNPTRVRRRLLVPQVARCFTFSCKADRASRTRLDLRTALILKVIGLGAFSRSSRIITWRQVPRIHGREYARIVIFRMGILLYSTPASAIIINHLTAMRTDYREDLEPVLTLLNHSDAQSGES